MGCPMQPGRGALVLVCMCGCALSIAFHMGWLGDPGPWAAHGGGFLSRRQLARGQPRSTASTAAKPECDPTYECQYRYQSLATGEDYVFDFSTMCTSTDYVANDNVGHTHFANVCGKAKQNCLPASWKNTYEYGVAVMTWGAEPSCEPPGCTDPVTGDAVCCTANCQVLGTGEPFWNLFDSSNAATGGVVARFKGAAASDSDPFWCDFNPATGSQYEREVHMIFQCAPAEPPPGRMIGAVQNSTNDCRFEYFFDTPLACGTSGRVVNVVARYYHLDTPSLWSRALQRLSGGSSESADAAAGHDSGAPSPAAASWPVGIAVEWDLLDSESMYHFATQYFLAIECGVRQGGQWVGQLLNTTIPFTNKTTTLTVPIGPGPAGVCGCLANASCSAQAALSIVSRIGSTAPVRGNPSTAAVEPMAPLPPQSAQVAVCGDGFLDMSWLPPVFSGGAGSVAHYDTRCVRTAANESIAQVSCGAETRSGRLQDRFVPLYNGDEYACTVRAVTSVGQQRVGQWSDTVTCVPRAAVLSLPARSIVLALVAAAAAYGIALALEWRQRGDVPRPRYTTLLTSASGLVHLAFDVYTAVDYLRREGALGLGFVAATVAGLLLSMALTARTLQLLLAESEETAAWVRENRAVVGVVATISTLKLSSVNLLWCHACWWRGFNAPVTDTLRARVHAMSLLPVLLEDVPQLVITFVIVGLRSQSLRVPGRGGSVWLQLPVVLNIVSSGVSVMSAAASRLVSLLVVTYGKRREGRGYDKGGSGMYGDGEGRLYRDGASYVALAGRLEATDE